METPNIDLEELKKLKEENFKDRLEFVEKYAKWVNNKKWSPKQKNIICWRYNFSNILFQ